MSECADLYAAIARLEAKIDGLQNINEQSIVDKAVKQISQLFDPKIAAIGLTATASLGGVNSLRAGLSAVSATANQALSGLGRLGALIAGIGGQVVPLAAGAASLAATAATIKLLEARADGLEQYIDSVSNDLSKVQSAAYGAKATADQALARSNQALGGVNALRALTNATKDIANDAKKRALSAHSFIIGLRRDLEHVRGTANNGLIVARRAEKRLDSFNAKLNSFEQGVRAIHGDFVKRLGIVVTYFTRTINGIQKEFGFLLDLHSNSLYKQGNQISNLNYRFGYLTNTYIPTYVRTAISGIAPTLRGQRDDAYINTRIDYLTNSYIPTYVRTAIATAKPGLRGERGLQGVQGLQGIQGLQGLRGLPGMQGLRGETGLQGIQGLRGLQGERGRDADPGLVNNLSNLVSQTIPRIRTLEGQIAEQERVNREGLNKLDRILLQTSAPALATAAKAGVCEAAQPNQCLGSPLGNLGNGLGNAIDRIGIIDSLLATILPILGSILAAVTDQGNGAEEPGTEEPSTEQSVKIDRIYRILGGDQWFPGDVEIPTLSINPLVELGVYADIIGDIDAEKTTKAPPSHSILGLIACLIGTTYARLGLQELPASLPPTIISTNEEPAENIFIPNLTGLLGWQFERQDEVWGQWGVPIEIKDSDPTTPGDQPVKMFFPNQAELMAEIYVLLFQISIDSQTSVNISTRTMLETGQDKQQNYITYRLLQSLVDWAGYKVKNDKEELPMLFTPGKTKFEELLVETKVPISIVEFDDKHGLEADLVRFRKASSILDAVYYRKINPFGDIKEQLMQGLKDKLELANKINGDDEDTFNKFLEDVQNGFMGQPGIDDPTRPYGRDFKDRPKIRDLTDYQPPQQ